MMILNLTRGSSGMCMPIQLPATPADIDGANVKLDQINTAESPIRFASVLCAIRILVAQLRKCYNLSAQYREKASNNTWMSGFPHAG